MKMRIMVRRKTEDQADIEDGDEDKCEVEDGDEDKGEC